MHNLQHTARWRFGVGNNGGPFAAFVGIFGGKENDGELQA